MPLKQPALSEQHSKVITLEHDTTNKSIDKQHKQRRKKLWDLPSHFHCSVIGTCFTLDELRRLCRKANIVFETPVTDHQIHSAFVNVAGESAYPSRLLQKHLEQKYKRVIQQFLKIRVADELLCRWKEIMQTGDIASAFWALLTHPYTSDKLLKQIYSDIHMLSHLAGASVRVDMQAFSLQRRHVEKLEAKLKKLESELKHKLREKNDTIRNMSIQHLQQIEQQRVKPEKQRKLSEMRKKINTQLASLASLQTQKERTENAASEWKQYAIRSEDRNLRLEQMLADARQERDALEKSLAGLLSEDCHTTCPQKKNEESLDLCNRCVLYVGGRSSQHSHFRTLVEQSNGRFIHHDGGRENSRHKLSSMLPQADAVICPLDCISHDAVRRVKRFCHRYGKRLVLLPRGSLSAFTRGLIEVAI